MARQLTAQNRRELAEQGYTIVPQLIGPQLASAGRQLIDDLLGESAPVPQVDPARYQPGPWPEGEPLRGTGSRLPVLTTENYRHSICHPICSHVAAELLLPFVALNEELLDCPAERLKLMQQMMVRTDASPPPHAGHGDAPPIGWHMDQAFLPRHYESQPRQMFYHTMLALSTVRHGCAPFFAATGSFRRARQTTEAMSRELQDEVVPHADETRTQLPVFLREHVADWVDASEKEAGGASLLTDLPVRD